jgi:hypothetical protein
MKKKSYSQIRTELKSLLFYFAKESDQPGMELQEVLREVINELHDEVKAGGVKWIYFTVVDRVLMISTT